MSIYLVRHGQTDWNLKRIVQGSSDIPLNDTGKKQAHDVADKIAKLKIDYIFSSDLLRARETAEIIGKRIGLPVILDERLREFNCGDIEGKLKSELPGGTTRSVMKQGTGKINAESAKSVFYRVKSFFDELVYKSLQNVLVVSHGGTIMMAMYYKKNAQIDEADYWDNWVDFPLNNTEIIEWV